MLRHLSPLLTLLTPAEPLHEATHAVAALLAGADVDVERSGLGASTRIEWQPGTPLVLVRLTHVAPTILGSMLGAAVAFVAFVSPDVFLAVARPLQDELEFVLSVYALVNWVIYVLPSYQDLFPLEE